MRKKGKREQRGSVEDAVFNRMLICLAAAVGAELLILLLRKVYVEMALGVGVVQVLMAVFSVLRFAGPVLILGGTVWLVYNLRGRRSTLAPGILIAASAAAWVIAMLLYYLFDVGANVLLYLPPVAAVLILIWFLYQRAFFVSAVITGCGAALLWLRRQSEEISPRKTALFIAGFVLLALAALAAWRLSRNGGKVGPLRVMPADSSYIMIYLTCAVTAVAMLLGLLLNTAAAFYLMLVLVAWLFVQAVYFTVKLM